MFNTLKGKIITKIEGLKKESYSVLFQTSDNKLYKMYHKQGCCESVEVEDVVGDVNDILNSEILLAEEVDFEEMGT